MARSPTVSPERAALAAAVAAYHECQTEHAALAEALDWDGCASRAVRTAEAAIAEATQAVEAARNAAATRLIDSSLGRASAPSQTIAEARAALAAAEDELEAARMAKRTLAGRLAEIKPKLDLRQLICRDKAKAVIKAEVAPRVEALLADLRRAERELLVLSSVVQWLALYDLAPYGEDFTHSPEGRDVWEHARGEWKNAIEALASDASASLPALPGQSR